MSYMRLMLGRRHVARHRRPQWRHEERDHGEEGAERMEAMTNHG